MRKLESFELAYNGKIIAVAKYALGEQEMYNIQLERPEKHLTITEAEDRSQKKFWTSLPQGRQKEAELFGALITDYYKNK